MASKKKKIKKIAKEGGYSWEHNNPLLRKRNKVQLKKSVERRPQKKG